MKEVESRKFNVESLKRGWGSGDSGAAGGKIKRSGRMGLGKHMERYHETIAAVK